MISKKNKRKGDRLVSNHNGSTSSKGIELITLIDSEDEITQISPNTSQNGIDEHNYQNQPNQSDKNQDSNNLEVPITNPRESNQQDVIEIEDSQSPPSKSPTKNDQRNRPELSK